MLTDIRPYKTQISKIVHLEEFFGTLLGKLTCPVMKMVIPLAKKILLPLKGRWAIAMCLGWEIVLVISVEAIDDIMKIIKSLEDSSLLADGISETVKNVIKEPRSAFLGMLLQNLSSLVLGNILTVRK